MTGHSDDTSTLHAAEPRSRSDASTRASHDRRPSIKPDGVMTRKEQREQREAKEKEPSIKKEVDSNGQNESEAETEILSDTAPERPEKPRRRVKADDSDADGGRRRASSANATVSKRTGADRRKSDNDTADDVEDGKRNGVVNGNGLRADRQRRKSTSTALSTSPQRSGANSRQENRRTPSDAQPSPPPNALKSPTSHRARSQSIAESRKRKARDDGAIKQAEPPRQRLKTDGSSARESASTSSRSNNSSIPQQPTSPAVKSHRRSASTQSAPHAAAASSTTTTTSASRRKRDLANLVLQSHKRESWKSSLASSSSRSSSPSDSDIDSSPRPSLPSVQQTHAQRTRGPQRSLTSPARAVAHDKKRTDRFGATRLAREAERGDIDAVMSAYKDNPDDLDQADFAGIAPLQKAALNGHVDVVKFLIEKGCKTDCQSDNRDTPLIDAAENGHLEVIKVLLRKGKVNPHHQNKKGERAIDLIPSDDEDHEEMSKELKEAMLRETDTGPQKDGPPTSAKAEPSGLLYNEYNTETLKSKAAEGDIQLVGELLASNVKPNIQCGIAAARAGHHEILSLFLAEGLKPDPDPSKHPDTPMTVAIGRGHLGVIELLLGQDNFDPTRRTKDGHTYFELSEERHGPKWEQERDMLKGAYDKAVSKRHKGSPKRERKQAPQHSQQSQQQQESHGNSSTLQAKTKSARRTSPRPSERSSSPSRTENKRQSGGRKIPTSEPDPPKRSRLLTGKEMSTQRDAAAVKRRRRVVADEDDSMSSGSEAQERRPKKLVAKPRAASEGPDGKPAKKHAGAASKARLEPHDKPRKLRTSSPLAQRSDESGGEGARKATKKSAAKTRSVDPSKTRNVQPTPETSSDAETNRKTAASKRHTSWGSSSKIKTEQTPNSPLEAAKSAAAQPSPTDTSKSATQQSPRAPSEPAAPSPAPPPPPAVPSRTPTPVREERLAEARRKEEEARHREQERQRIASERERLGSERLAREQELARLESERAAREARLSKLPPALRRACERGLDRPLCFDGDEMGVIGSFFPVHVFPLSEVDPAAAATSTAIPAAPAPAPSEAGAAATASEESANADAEAAKKQLFMLSFQAVGILGLPELDIAQFYPSWERRPVTEEQWELFLQQYDVARVAQDFRFPLEGSKYWDDGDVQRKLWDSREKMKAMCGGSVKEEEGANAGAGAPVCWIPFDAFKKEVLEGGLPPVGVDVTKQVQLPAAMREQELKAVEEEKALDEAEKALKASDPDAMEVDKKEEETPATAVKMEVDAPAAPATAPATASDSAPVNPAEPAASTAPAAPPSEPATNAQPAQPSTETADSDDETKQRRVRESQIRELLRKTAIETKSYIRVQKPALPPPPIPLVPTPSAVAGSTEPAVNGVGAATAAVVTPTTNGTPVAAMAAGVAPGEAVAKKKSFIDLVMNRA